MSPFEAIQKDVTKMLCQEDGYPWSDSPLSMKEEAEMYKAMCQALAPQQEQK